MMSATPAIVCWMLLPVVGAWLGLSISWDWSESPVFPNRFLGLRWLLDGIWLDDRLGRGDESLPLAPPPRILRVRGPVLLTLG